MTEQKPNKKSKITFTEVALFVLVIALAGALVYTQITKKPAEWDKVVSISGNVITDLSSSGWNPETVESYATPALKDWVKNSKDLDLLNKALAKLGAIKANNGVELLALNKVSAVTVSKVNYENGEAAITVNFKKDGEKWLVDKININSPQLKAAEAEKPAEQPVAQ